MHLALPDFWRAENGRPCTMKTPHLCIRLGSGCQTCIRVGVRVGVRVSDMVRARVGAQVSVQVGARVRV